MRSAGEQRDLLPVALQDNLGVLLCAERHVQPGALDCHAVVPLVVVVVVVAGAVAVTVAMVLSWWWWWWR